LLGGSRGFHAPEFPAGERFGRVIGGKGLEDPPGYLYEEVGVLFEDDIDLAAGDVGKPLGTASAL
jgi:hypothetical protein